MKKAKCFNFIVLFFSCTIIVLKYDRHPNKHTANKYLLKCQLSLPGFFLLATGCCGQTADPEATNPKRGEGRGGGFGKPPKTVNNETLWRRSGLQRARSLPLAWRKDRL